MRAIRLNVLFVLIALAWQSVAQAAWWNEDWSFRKEIGFDLSKAGADIAGSPADVPVLIRLSLGNFSYFGDALPDGADLRFVAADDETPLAHHFERYDAQAQMAFVWVRVPRLVGGASSDKMFLYYGNKEAKSSVDAGGSYDVNQALVYHFGTAPGQPQDATSHRTEPATFGAEVIPASLMGSGARFDGAHTISVPSTPVLRLVPETGFTVSAWVRVEAAQQQAYVAALQESGKALILGLDGLRAFARWNDGAAPAVVAESAVPIGTGAWHHLALRLGNGRMTLFVDGRETAAADVGLQETAGALTIGGSAQGGSMLTGELDELEVSNTARASEWIRAVATSQGVGASLVVYGGDTQREGGGSESYFGTTLRNVTVDGWVIIAVLAIMFVVSIVVMAGKALYLRRVARGNSMFLGEFHIMSDDPAALERFEAEEAFGLSTLWQLYHHGMRETMKRLEGQAAGAARVNSLSPQSIAAIRATLDASLTRMTQRLNSRMVVLTIAIAGGPFLGLLGTVVGVMITFAAIAATGDVNINAIAPGTAAALVATVAGLGVAIPCLFGYNFLGSRIKEISADMRVFIDEFVTRIAETYS